MSRFRCLPAMVLMCAAQSTLAGPIYETGTVFTFSGFGDDDRSDATERLEVTPSFEYDATHASGATDQETGAWLQRWEMSGSWKTEVKNGTDIGIEAKISSYYAFRDPNFLGSAGIPEQSVGGGVILTNSVSLFANTASATNAVGRRLNYNLRLRGDFDGDTGGEAEASVQIFVLKGPAEFDVIGTTYNKVFTFPISVDPTLTITSDPLSANLLNSATVFFGLNLNAKASNTIGESRDWNAFFGRTLTLESITFADDGTTPEENGYDLILASGDISPNLRASTVPEPSSFAACGLAIASCLGFRWRRRRTKRGCECSTA